MNKELEWHNIKIKIKDIATKYIQYCLLIDINSTSKISKDYTLEILDINDINNYTRLNNIELEKRVNKINSFRIAFNKLTTEERKIIYWTYLDKIIMKETYKKLYTLLNTILSDIEKRVIEMIYGIKGKQYKQIEISDILNIRSIKFQELKKSFKTIKMLY